MVSEIPDPVLIALAAFGGGILLGLAARVGRFCTLGAIEDLLYQDMRQPGALSSVQTNLPSGLQIGSGVQPVANERLHSQGNLEQTGNSKDVAIDGRGFFAVQMPDGTNAYTRDGSLQIDQNGQLVTASGFPIEPAITIPENALSISVATDGTVSVTQPGTAENGNGRVVMKTAGGLKVSVSEKQSPVLRTSGELTEWLIPVTEVNTQIEVDYSW